MASRSSSRVAVLRLYRQMMREGQKFSAYNLRMYASRRVRDAFRANKDLEQPEGISEALKFAEQNYEMMKRQVIVGNLYKTHPLVIEGEQDVSQK